jgi:isopenicillin-N epimerase
LWGEDWPTVRSHWTLDPSVVFLNHGSFGACPRPVLEAQAAWRLEMERQPVEFLSRRLPRLLGETREGVAGFLGADPSGLVFVPNATTAINTVLASMLLRPGDQVLCTDHAYPAVANTIGKACSSAGAERVVCHVPLPLPKPEDIVAAVVEAITDRTRMAIVEHVTSPTAAILPVAEIVEACHRRNVPVLVDAAHGPGMLPVDLSSLGCEFWTGNFHKWACAPKGAAVLAIAPERREDVHPLVTSHGMGKGLQAEFEWTGTRDPTAYLAIPAALEFMGALGWDRVRRHNHELVLHGRAVVSEALRTVPPVAESRIGSMAIASLPDGAGTSQEEADDIQARLFEISRIEVPFISWHGWGFVRLSAQAYNRPADFARLAAVLPSLLRGPEGPWSCP